MQLYSLTLDDGQAVVVNFDHVHFFRATDKLEKDQHPRTNTRIATDTATFYVMETLEDIYGHIKNDDDNNGIVVELIDLNTSIKRLLKLKGDKHGEY